MSDVTRCARCRSPIPDDAPHGLCPLCLLQLAMGADAPTPPGRPRAGGGRDADPAAGAADPGPPTGLSNYDILGELGRGGMGVVYKARQRGADRLVAVKVIRNDDDGLRERLAGEARALARLSHPNIVQVYEVGGEGEPFFSMEYVEGGSLADRLRRGEEFTPTAAARLIRSLAEAVGAAHEAGVLHRDLKPANVLLTEDGSPKVTDFGLALWLGREEGQSATGVILGTPSYMAPEQAAGRPAEVGPRTDVYALGATLYEMLTGAPPFKADTALATATLVTTAEPAAPRDRRPGLSAELEAICLKCLEKAPVRRYPTAAALAADLTRWLRGESTVARPHGPLRRALRAVRPQAVALAGCVLLLAAAVAGSAARHLGGPPAPADPDAVVRRYAGELAAGRPVTLVGASGPPAWWRWFKGEGHVTQSAEFSQVLRVEAQPLTLLQLLPDPGRDRYRVSAEVHVERLYGTLGRSGVYVGGQALGRPDGPHGVRFLAACAEDWLDRPGGKWAGGSAVPVGGLVAASRTGDEQLIAIDPIGRRAPLRACGWRQLIVEAEPDGLRVFVGEPGAEPRRVDACTARDLAVNAAGKRKQFARFVPGGLPVGDWSSRSPLGLVVENAAVAVRNVLIEPL